MPLYFFHLRNERDHILDEAGREVADPADLPLFALREARAIIAADALAGRIDLAQRIEVDDAAGNLVLTLDLADAVSVIGARGA